MGKVKGNGEGRFPPPNMFPENSLSTVPHADTTTVWPSIKNIRWLPQGRMTRGRQVTDKGAPEIGESHGHRRFCLQALTESTESVTHASVPTVEHKLNIQMGAIHALAATLRDRTG